MNTHMIQILIRKDIRLVLTPALLYLAAGVASLALMAIKTHATFYAGSVMLITSMIALGFHPSMATVIGERKEKTLAFVMSMPITPTDFTVAKLVANLLVFFVPWTLLLIGCTTLITTHPTIPDGLLPFAFIQFGTIAIGAVLILCVAIASESMQLTIACQIAGNLAFQGIMYASSNTPAIKDAMNTETIVWSGAVMGYLGSYAALAVLMLIATLWLQSRKTDFL